MQHRFYRATCWGKGQGEREKVSTKRREAGKAVLTPIAPLKNDPLTIAVNLAEN